MEPRQFLALPREAMSEVLAKRPELVNERFTFSHLQFKSQLLHHAAEEGNRTAIEILVGAGADVNSITDAGMTPLHFAAAYGKPDACLALLEQGANHLAAVRADLFRPGDVRGCFWFTPLHTAIEMMVRVQEDVFPDYLAVARSLIEVGTPLYKPYPSANVGSVLVFIRDANASDSRRAACIKLFPKPLHHINGVKIDFVVKQYLRATGQPTSVTVTVDLVSGRNTMKPIPHRQYELDSIHDGQKLGIPEVVPVVLAPDGLPYGMLIRVKDLRQDRHFIDVTAIEPDEAMTVETSLDPYQQQGQDRYTWHIQGVP